MCRHSLATHNAYSLSPRRFSVSPEDIAVGVWKCQWERGLAWKYAPILASSSTVVSRLGAFAPLRSAIRLLILYLHSTAPASYDLEHEATAVSVIEHL